MRPPPPADAPTRPASAPPPAGPPAPGHRERARECSNQRLVRQRTQWWRTVLRTSVLRKQKKSVTTKPCERINRQTTLDRRTRSRSTRNSTTATTNERKSARDGANKGGQSIRGALLTLARPISTRGIGRSGENGGREARFLRDIKVAPRSMRGSRRATTPSGLRAYIDYPGDDEAGDDGDDGDDEDDEHDDRRNWP